MAEAKTQTQRPLSPHLQIYTWSWTMAMSILHRATGAVLYGGTLLIAAWLVAAASGPRAFDQAQALAGSWFGKLILFGYTFALLQHMLGGLRHFVWDLGHGYGAEQRRNLAKYSIFVAAGLTVLIWIVALSTR